MFHSEVVQKIIKHGFLFSIASIIALNALIEDFSGNNELGGDLALGILGVAMGVIVAELYANKINRSRI